MKLIIPQSKELSFQIQIPELCPNCGVANNPTFVENGVPISLLKEGGEIRTFLHRCPRCEKYHVTIQEKISPESEFQCILFYPNKISHNLDPLFIKYAPRFSEFYSEATEAEKLGLENIAGTGYRSAIECLIKDYALHFELDDKEYLSNPKLNFNNAIDRYVKDDDLLKGALHFIREVGNGYTHWDKSTAVSLPVLKSYVEIILQIFKSKFMLKHLPK